MKLSTKGRYGLRALIDLALYSNEEAVPLQSIAARQGISESYLEQLMRLLRKAGLVKSIRGASGGYVLGKPAQEISVGDILLALEGNLEAVTCPTSEDGEVTCSAGDCCVTRHVWQKVNESIISTVNSIWLSDLVEESRQLRAKGISPAHDCVR